MAYRRGGLILVGFAVLVVVALTRAAAPVAALSPIDATSGAAAVGTTTPAVSRTPTSTATATPSCAATPTPGTGATPQYAFSFAFDGNVPGKSLPFNNPKGIATDSGGNVYVIDHGNFLIKKFDASGNFLLSWGGSGTANGKFSDPSGIAIDASGLVYVGDANGSVQVFDSTGAFQAKWTVAAPTDLAVDASGNVYLYSVGPYSSFIAVYAGPAPSTLLRSWPTAGGNVGLDRAANIVYTSTTNAVLKFSSFGCNQGSFGSAGNGNGQFLGAAGIAVDGNSTVYVADGSNGRVETFDPSGRYLTQMGTKGTAIGQIQQPFGVAVGPSGAVYVTDDTGNRVDVYAPVATTSTPTPSPSVTVTLTSSVTLTPSPSITTTET